MSKKRIVTAALSVMVLVMAVPEAAQAHGGRGWGHRHYRAAPYLGLALGAGALWYLAPRPTYVYPEPYVPPVVVAPQAPAVAVQPQIPVWYYCDASGAYYPHVQSCPSGWREVPATPPQ